MAFSEWCRRLNLSEQAKATVERIRQAPPSRAVQSGAGNVTGAYPSRKMGLTIQFESHKNELALIYLLEHDPDVLEFYDQPEAIKLSYLTGKEKPIGCLHTPDFFVLRQASAGWEECKMESALSSLAEQMPNRYVQAENGRWNCPPGQDYARRFGFYYRIASSSEINWNLQRNFVFLEDYYRSRSSVPPEVEANICAAVAAAPGITLAGLIESAGQDKSRDNIFALIAEEKVYIDLSVAALAGDPERVFVFRDRATAHAISVINAAPSANIIGVVSKTALVEVRVGASFLWDGRSMRILNVGRTNLSLLAEDEQIIEIKLDHWEGLLRTGSVTGVKQSADTDGAKRRDEAAKLIAAAHPKDLATANFRYAALVNYLRDDMPILEPLPADSPPARTLRRWRKRYRLAESTYGCGFLGLLPERSEQGNRSPRLPDNAVAEMTKFIMEKFETPELATAASVYGSLKLACDEQGIICPSRKTFLLALKARPGHTQLAKRQGKRKAYTREPFYLELEQTTPRHGDRPFEIAHIDHTELDVELICSRTGRNLGRPWLTLMIDAFSRRILAVYITFDPPSYRSCMMVLRICVLRHGRLPQFIVTDGGKEFASVYFQALLAAYDCTRKKRPPAKARFGSVGERVFGTTNKQFVHLLVGNTQIMRNARQVTKSVNPKHRALWTLPLLYERLAEYAYEIYDGNVHPALGQTPAEAFALGLKLSGERLNNRVAYDEGFKMLTLPTTQRGVAKVQPNTGVKINYINYWASELGNPEVEKTFLPVRYDPFDLSRAYVFVSGRWTKCVSSHWAVFRGRSERELLLASAILHRQNQNHAGREMIITTKRLAEFMGKIRNNEEMLLQREKDLETQTVTSSIEGGVPKLLTDAPLLHQSSADSEPVYLSEEADTDHQDLAPKPSEKVSPWALAANPDNLEKFGKA